MKIFRLLGRSIRDAFKSVIRNFSLSLASISCITITLIIVAIAIMASFNVQNFTKEIERDLTIVVFMDNDATEEDVNAMKEKLDSKKNIAKYTFESKNDVRKDMMKENDVFESVMKDWKNDENPLRDTFKIKVNNVDNMGKTADELKDIIVDVMFIIYVDGDIITNKINYAENGPTVILFVGVNGAGKTTTIGKIAYKLKEEGKKVLMIAGDTFRAVDIEQLVEWSKRIGVDIFS